MVRVHESPSSRCDGYSATKLLRMLSDYSMARMMAAARTLDAFVRALAAGRAATSLPVSSFDSPTLSLTICERVMSIMK